MICLKAGGPATQVTPDCGFLVRPGTPQQVTADVEKILLGLARDPGLQVRLGMQGRRRVAEHFDWELKGWRMKSLYEELVG